ncbi:glycoside hydrolase family 15 protein [Bacteriovoracaceae bacterium]|nr:glycoside hydrolase family 15 protein [Bacteriovoracaceae bacterium]
MKVFNFILLCLFTVACSSLKNKTPKQVLRKYLRQNPTHKTVLTSEGQFVQVFNPRMVKYIKKPLTRNQLLKIEQILKPAVKIELTKNNFTKAAERFEEGKKDETNYDAVWVRDSAWVYFALNKSGQKEKATKLITALWDYYSHSNQLERMKKIIQNPALAATSKMNVPHIRFDGASKNFEDVMEKGKPQLWNHRQNDAHGLFLLALADAFKNKLIDYNSLNSANTEVVTLFPKYFLAINYHQFKGAGAWEEVDKINTSSIAMVVKSFEQWSELEGIKGYFNWNRKDIDQIISDGYKTIRYQLSLGGEAPQSDPRNSIFRLEDAALFNLFLPMPLKQLTELEKRYALTLVEKLIRPYGVIRYPNDSYQAGNYWIKDKSKSEPELTGDASSDELFLARFKKIIPNTEAQWFFDSKISMIYSQFYQNTINENLKQQAKYKAIYHYKRALGQITGSFNKQQPILAADAKEVRNFQVPESINTIVIDEKKYYVPSPITPLNWAKAGLILSGLELEKIIN